MASRSDTFGRLLKAGISSIANCEGRTAPAIEDELGVLIGVAGYTIQRYKAGYVPPEPGAVRILAEACVRRGFLNRTWLASFLQAARYPHSHALIDELCPPGPAQPRAERVYANLPAPTYSQFIMRPDAYADVLDGLRQRSAVILIASLGGMGKTSLAREVAAACLLPGANPRFDAAVWVSDKDRPGATNLSLVLDEIARTLDYPGLAQFAFDEKRREAEQLLRRMRVLVVLDNFETVTDAALADWLLRLPEPSKAIITTREYRRAFRSSWPIDLGGMTDAEARALIAERLRVLKLDRAGIDTEQLAPLIAAAGGNPKALELALGLMKYEHRPLAQLLGDLQTARGTLFDDLFERAWALLDGPARDVLLALPLFASGAAADALAETAGVRAADFERATELLADLTLLHVHQAGLSAPIRFTQHPLVRAFAQARLAGQPAFEQAARLRWLGWYRALAAQVGFCWNDLARLDWLDPEHETLYAAIEWALGAGHDAAAIDLIEGVRYYYNVRGIWDERQSIHAMRAAAARRLGDAANEALGLAFDIEVLSKQGTLDAAGALLPRLLELADTPQFSGDVRFEIGHARALYARAHGDYAAAEATWRAMLPISATLAAQKSVVNRRWLATCRYQQGDVAGAQALFRESLADARACGDVRSVLGNTLKIAAIALEQGDLAAAAVALDECREGAERLRDRRRLGEYHQLAARLQALRGDAEAAQASLEAAADLFERMGMRRELADTRALQARLGGPDGALGEMAVNADSRA